MSIRPTDPGGTTIDEDTYNRNRLEFLIALEDGRLHVYDDDSGKPLRVGQAAVGARTVGIGFNMGKDSGAKGLARQKEAKAEWDHAFKDWPASKRPDFERVRLAHDDLTEEQVAHLFDYAIRTRQMAVLKDYGDVWSKLPPHMRLAIESLNYNGPSLIKDGTQFHKAITGYAAETDAHRKKEWLARAAWEVEHNSNPLTPETRRIWEGLQKRRIAEAMLLLGKVDAEKLKADPDPHAKKPPKPRFPEDLKPPARERHLDLTPELDRLRVKAEQAQLGTRQRVRDMAADHMRDFATDVRRLTGLLDFDRDEPYLATVLVAAEDDLRTRLDKLPGQVAADVAVLLVLGRTENQLSQQTRNQIDQIFEDKRAQAQETVRLRLHQQLDAHRQQQYGLTHYVWRSQDDAKVRPQHSLNDDKIFAWNNPPPTGHPGADYGCRCRAEPVVSGRWG